MEGRLPAGLYLEADGRSSDAIAAQPGVARVTTWDNAHPGRTDLPHRLAEFTTLTVAEVTAAYTPADHAPGWHMRRTPRPGQGILTGRPTTGLLVVLISPRTPAQAQALRDWADHVHIREIAAAAVPGFTMITPYEHARGGEPRYLHLYEMDTDDPEAAFASMTGLVAARIGPTDSPAWKAWAWHPALRIEYVNTFRRAS